jgi:uncharacterized protein (TIGR02172 family)
MNQELGELLGIGKTAEIYSFEKNKAVKLFYPGKFSEKIKHEGNMVKELTALGISTPKVVDFVTIENRQGIVFEKVEGKSLTTCLTRKPWSAKSLGQTMATFHADLHKQTVSALFEPRNNFMGKLRLSSNFLGDRSEKIIQYYNTLPSAEHLCHGDFHPTNIIIDNKELIVIDWADAYSGNCLGDVARTLLILKSPDIPSSVPFLLTFLTRPIRNQLAAAYLEAYTKITGVHTSDVQAWMLPVAASRLVEGISNEKEWLIKIIDRELTLRCSAI